MADKVHSTSQGIVHDIKSGLHGIHGAGEAIRGGAMEALDGVFHKKDGEAKDRAIYAKGIAEIQGTEDHFEARGRQHQQHAATHHDSVTYASSHSHHDHAGHGQGSHFAQTHTGAVGSTPDYQSAGVAPGEIQSREAAQNAWHHSQ